MKTSLGFLAFAALLVVCPVPGTSAAAAPGDTEESLDLRERSALEDLRFHHPRVGAHVAGGRVTRLYGEPFSRGATPRGSAEEFVRSHVRILGAEPSELVPGNHFNDRVVQQVMPDREKGGYRFTLVYYRQELGGIPVYGADLRLLVRNEEGFPLVLAASSLRRLGGLSVPPRESLPVPGEAARRPALASEAGLVFATPAEYVIWAGVDDADEPARLAVTFAAADSEDPGRIDRAWRFVTDPYTGEVLHRESLVQHDVSGDVRLMRTEGYAADICLDETSQVMPYARLFIFPLTTAFADRWGSYTIGTFGPLDPTVESNMEGRYFKVETHRGENENLKRTVAPDAAGVDFLHNADNDSNSLRAQANGYYFANLARLLVLDHNPDYPTISGETGYSVHVNHPGSADRCPCNAWHTRGVLGLGDSINFCRPGSTIDSSGAPISCPNTAFGGIVLHEYGHHAVHLGGSGQGQYGEGMGDVFELLKTDDSRNGVGIFRNCSSGDRSAANNVRFPCKGEIHACGRLLSGAVWETREELAVTRPADYLAILGDLMVNSILLHQGQRIDRSVTLDVLTLDDDDGVIINGTPHSEEIVAGFGAHNLGPTGCAPERVLNVAAGEEDCDGIQVDWDPAENAFWYTVWRHTLPVFGDAVEVGEAAGTSLFDTGVRRATDYYYWVRGHNGCGPGPHSVISVPSVVGRRLPAPGRVRNVAATDGTECGGVRILWSDLFRARTGRYRVWRAYGVGEDPPWSEVGTTSRRRLFDSGVPPGEPFLYRVQALGKWCPGPLGRIDAGYARALPSPPATVDASDEAYCGSVRVSWSPVDGAGSYEIWRGTTPDTAGATLLGTDDASPYEDATAVPGVSYVYWVRPRDDCGTGPFGAGTVGSAKGPPGTPSQGAASQGTSCGYVRVSWRTETGAASYRIWRGVADDPSAAESLGYDTSSPFDDTTAAPGQAYHYWVQAANACGGSGYGPAGTGWRPANPEVPVMVGASDDRCGYVRLWWNASAGATSYEIWRNTTDGTTGATLLGATSASPWDDTGAANGVTYWYWVRAVGPCGVSGFSGSDSGLASPTVAAPAGVAASSGFCGYTRVSWGASPGAAGYRILRHTANSLKDAAQVGTAAASPWDDTGSTPFQTYYYWVAAVDSCGVLHAGASDPGSRSDLPEPPKTVGADGYLRYDIEVSWNPSTGATSYQVWRGTTTDAKEAGQIATTGAGPYLDGTAVPMTTYYYWIKATGACGTGDFSPMATGVLVPPG